jgi:prepilin-type N-terminal cleavage/methylation domain-containing protein
MTSPPQADKGFTLLEVILALVLTGLLAAIAGAGVISGFNLFAAARDNTHITQKANLALTRLTRELREITNVIDVHTDPLYLIYEGVDDGAFVRKAVAFGNGTIKLFSNLDDSVESMDATYIADNGDILIDNVTGFSLNYFISHLSAEDDTDTWLSSNSIRKLSAIKFEFTITRDTMGGRTTTFGNTVHLRNNNNYGGANPSVTPPTPPTQSSYPCFIATSGRSQPVGLWWLLLPLSILSLLLVRRPRCKPSGSGSRSGLPVHSRGAALIAVIVVLVVFSALAIIMLPMITTSQYTQLGQDAASKAYYLAESGYRYAASQYLKAGSDSAKNTALESLHGHTFTLSGGDGSFQLDLYPYYGYVQSDPSGGNTLTIRLPGGLSPDLDNGEGNNAFSGSGRLQIGREFFSYNSGNTSSSPNISFEMTATMPSVPIGTDVYFVGKTNASPATQTVSKGDTIYMAPGSTRTFPLRNGEVVINDNVYTYRENIRSDTDPAQLVGITDPEDLNMPALSLDAGTEVVLNRFVDLKSTGNYGDGSIKGERLLTYHVPLPNSTYSQRRQEFRDTFEDLGHWKTIWGAQEVKDIGGDAMTIKETDDFPIGFYPRISLVALDLSDTEIDLEWIHQRADYYLSYDAQVKIGFLDRDLEETPTPDWGFTPPDSDIPTYFAAGISFRLDEDVDVIDDSHNAYGLSIIRGNKAAPYPRDNLPNELLDTSFNDKLVLLLWQQTGDGADLDWLAYKEIGDVEMFLEDVESGTNGWTPASQWAISAIRARGGTSSWHFSRDGVNSGVLVSPEITECDYDYLRLSYYSWHAKAAGDTLSVEFRSHDGSVWSGWSEIDRVEGLDSGGDWVPREAVIAVTPGAPVQFRFRYDTDTGDTDSYDGWFIDDIRVGGDWPVQEATIALRIQEAPSLRFSGGGSYEIERGDQIYQGTASAIVDTDPILTSGSFLGGDAAGHLVLKNYSGEFNTSTSFSVIGVGPVGIVQEVRARDNFIRVYYGSPKGCGTSNDDPLDNIRLANPRDSEELHWPPADGEAYTAADDYFTLIQWDSDKINTSVSSFARLTATQLRSNESVLLTPEGPLGQTRAELGLHALGKGAANTYFDDFGLTVTFNRLVDITSPLQE